MSTRLAVLGASGHTGRLVVPALLARGATVLACGRDENALAALHEAHGVETARVDVTEAGSVRAALRDADGVANLAGPFLETGPMPIEAALRRGIPYVDTTGEQLFMARARARYHARALEAGAPVVNALAYEYALADLAVAARLPEGGDALHVLYRSRGAQTSAGTKKSMARALASKAFGYEDGRLRPVAAARWRHRFPTDQGPRDGVSFPGGEILTVPRHAPFRTVRTYVPAPRSRALAMRLAAPLARLALRGPVLRAVERRIDRAHVPPRNEDARAEIHLDARGPDRRVVVRMGDPYAATAEVCAEGLVRLASGRAKAAGVLSPAEALPAAPLLDALSARIALRVESPPAAPTASAVMRAGG
jgi:short subunit dehydrogenase-like uncharacterized protein